MGYGTWNDNDWRDLTFKKSITRDSKISDIMKSTSIKKEFNPYGVSFRESCDSKEHPNSTPIIIGIDVTGSMGYLPEELAKGGLNQLVLDLYEKNKIIDPQIMFMAIGDAYCDSAPLQITQFESDIKIAEQLLSLYFEGGGGGNHGESYLTAWYFALNHTKIDSFDKHGEKGFLFTIGDECCHPELTSRQISRIFGDESPDLSASELFEKVSKKYEVYHLIVGNHRYHNSQKSWNELIGERTIVIDNISDLPKTIERIMILTQENK